MKKSLLIMLAVVIAICLAGRMDFNEDVLYHMSDGTYEVLREKLGDVSQSELVDAYLKNPKYWDSLGILR